MSSIQLMVLRALSEKPMNTVGVGQRIDSTVKRAENVLMTLVKKGLVDMGDSGWELTEKGRKKVVA